VRLADIVLRRGHLSESALAEVCVTGHRPVHLDQCDVCAERAVQLGRWLDDVRTVAVNDADAAFPAERLVAQQAQILRRLEQLDRPARVIAFPTQSQYDRLAMGSSGVRPAWIGIAAAAGVVLGLVGGQVSFRVSGSSVRAPAQPAQIESPAAMQAVAYQEPQSLREFDETETLSFDSLSAMDELVPHAIQVSLQKGTVR
jgi:hypothetical protein